jgi:adenine C2-methylase RlmN of 23S rRNA A2503 and tRNA A37
VNNPDNQGAVLPQTTYREANISGYQTGVLDISLASRRILSVPTQLGCSVGCTFCISSSRPVIRNLTSAEILHLVNVCLQAEPPDGRPIEMSFTGEGEAVVNWRETSQVCRELPALSSDFNSVRYCFSGLGSDILLAKLDAGSYPMRLQFSLHAARQHVRDRLVPRSLPLHTIADAIRTNAHKFVRVELNVVLQNGINDTPEDLEALSTWGDNDWTIVLNPLLEARPLLASDKGPVFEQALRLAGRRVRRYSNVAESISKNSIYPLLTVRNIK